MTPPSNQQQMISQLSSLIEVVHGLDKKIDRLEIILNEALELAEKHDRALYRSNGNLGLLDRFDDLEDIVKEHHDASNKQELLVTQRQEKNREEWRKAGFGILTAIVLMVIDILVHIVPFKL
jgi:hypothetical protein